MELFELTVHELINKLRNKEASSQEIVDSFFKRIQDVEGKVNSFITLTEDLARQRAKKSDQGLTDGALAGIPYGLKDAICTRGVRTTCASKMLENFIPPYDATVTARLNQAGGILTGKLNMDEFAMGSSTEMSAFFTTHNPWDLTRVPGGSSGGPAAAVAASEIPFALGTDSGGSIRQPAAFCGVVGLKPTYGRVSRWGVIAYASSFDQVGVLSKDVQDCALVMNVISGYDHKDSTCIDKAVPDYLSYLQNDIKGIKIGYPKEYFQQGVDPQIAASLKKALRTFEELGAIVEEVSLPHSEYALPAYYLIAPAEASANMARFDGVRYGFRDQEADNVLEMFARSRGYGFGDEVKRRIMLGTYALSSGYYEDYYLKAAKVRRLISDDFAQVFKDFDLIVSPTTPTTAFKLGENAKEPLTLYMNDILTAPVNMAGLPGISIPCGFIDGLPVGMQIIGRPFDEGTILKAAYTFEQNTDYHTIKPALGVE
ncbi:MAG: Asp-tRNA(Asn)/Glu-tRNA(Gln) amidotransferase subunit GatA [Syntrophomonadaceae bacterium]|jgi:aspartyl-tRNA(Asn)/glutamyl-tRNA(Gln) amidotransferase subunit A